MARVFQFAVGRTLGDPPAAIVAQVVDDATGKPLEGVAMLARQGNTTRSVALSDSGGYFALVGLRQDASYQLAAVDHAIESVAPGGIDVILPTEGDVLGLVVRASAEANSLSTVCSGCELREGGVIDASAEQYAERMAWSMQVFRSVDPNEKDGPVGEGEDDDLIAVDEPILYRAYFANERGAGANAPAQTVILVDRLVSHLDTSTVEFKEVQVGGDSLGQRLFFGTPGPSSSPSDPVSSATGSSVSGTHSFDELMSIDQETAGGPRNYLIRVQGTASGGVLVVKFLPESPSLDDLEADEGFLPSSTHLKQNEGYVSFTIRPNSILVPLTEPELPSIENRIDIKFDENPEEPTDKIRHQLSHLLPLDLQGPVPAHEATGVSPDSALQWFDRLTDTHQLYLSTDPVLSVAPVPVDERFYRPPTGLAEGVTYYWRVIAHNDRGFLEGPTWSFTTALRADCPIVPGSDPTPIPNAVEVRKSQFFAWPDFPGASSYDLYVWSADSARPESPSVSGFGASEFLGRLEPPLDTETTYNWQVVASNSACDSIGPVWTFRTIDSGYQIPGDFDQSGRIDQTDAIALLGRLFNGNPARAPCGDGSTIDPANFALLNWNGDKRIDQSDAIALLIDTFAGGGGWHVLGRDCIHILGCPDACDP